MIFTAVLVYVDDMVIVGNHNSAIEDLKQYLNLHFHMKDMEELKYFLGLEVIRTAAGIFLCQRKYTLDFLAEAGLSGCKPLQLPLPSNVKLLADSGIPLNDPNQYRRMIGKMIYLTITRPDITYSVQVLSQFMNSPTEDHMKAAVHVLKYLKSSPGQGIFLARDSTAHLYAYCDSDWGGCPNSRKSTADMQFSWVGP